MCLNNEKMMNGVRYLKLLDYKLRVFMQLHGTTHFLWDEASCHKSKIVMEWFNNRPNISHTKWLGNSPDLELIEYVWARMKNQLTDTNCKNKEG